MVGSQIEVSRGGVTRQRWGGPSLVKGRVLVVEDEIFLRQSLGELLGANGYEVAFAGDGRAALGLLRTEALPDLIILDLKLPVMDGWEFRAIQKGDPKLGLIPLLVVSADGSPKALAISADGYLRKPFDANDVMAAVERILFESEQRLSARQDETERLAALGRVAANVGHEINNPLTFVMLNLRHSLEELHSSLSAPPGQSSPEVELARIKTHVVAVTEMLQECETGSERIRATVTSLQQLSHKSIEHCGLVDLRTLIEESASMASDQLRQRARLTMNFGEGATIRGHRAALGQVFLNLLVNAAQSIPKGEPETNDIRVATRVDRGLRGPEVVVEIRDSGAGIAPELVSRVFEPYFTTKALGEGTGLGLSISRQTVNDHGGRLTVESELGKGTVFRVFLPVDLPVHVPVHVAAPSSSPVFAPPAPAVARRGRVLVIDDEPLIGRVIDKALKDEHDVVAVEHAFEALALLERGETFDMALCDLIMPTVSGPEFYALVAERWPQLATRLVFMTGGAFTPLTVEFLERVPTAVLSKPFAMDDLKQLVRQNMSDQR